MDGWLAVLVEEMHMQVEWCVVWSGLAWPGLVVRWSSLLLFLDGPQDDDCDWGARWARGGGHRQNDASIVSRGGSFVVDVTMGGGGRVVSGLVEMMMHSMDRGREGVHCVNANHGLWICRWVSVLFLFLSAIL